MTRKAIIYFYKEKVGSLIQKPDGFYFNYLPSYLKRKDAHPISLTLPIKDKIYKSDVLFPFFDGLLPEGIQLKLTCEVFHLDSDDRMGLLLACCKDCIGAVSILPQNLNAADK